jgi:peptide/nickel transport system permease protein
VEDLVARKSVDRTTATTWRRELAFLWYLFTRNPLSLVGAAIVGALVVIAVVAPIVAPFNPTQPDMTRALQPPSSTHLFGTDGLGMDVFSRVLAAARLDLYMAIASVVIAIVIGVPIGAVSGFAGGVFDEIMMRLLDSVQSFPPYILAMAIVTAAGQDVHNIIFVLAFVNFPIYSRLVRAQMLSIKETQYADAARTLGNPPWRIVLKHLLPNCLGPVYVQGSINAGWALLLAAGLSFIGLGVRVPTPEWGLMVSMGSRQVVFGQWWVSFFPGLAIFLAILGFNLLGDGLQDVFDPKRR